jgi:preprotein translocase subunit SecD
MDRVVRPKQNSPVIDTNDLLPNARASVRSDGKPTLGLELTEQGAKAFADSTGNHVGECLAVFANGRLITAPTIMGPMQTSRFEVTGFASLSEADALAKQINGGSVGQP